MVCNPNEIKSNEMHQPGKPDFRSPIKYW